MKPLAIQTTRLRYHRDGMPIIDDLNLEVPIGSIFGLLGPNGSGKTTTIRLLLNLLQPSAGTAHIFGAPHSANRCQLLRSLGCLIELPTLYPHLTGRENLEITRLLRNLPKRTVAPSLELVGLTSSAHRKVSTYSLGMRQRLGIALALMGDPELIILDEPTNGLDPAGILDIRNLITELNREQGKTILISSHFLSEIEKIATDVAILNNGRLAYQGPLSLLTVTPGATFTDLETIFLNLTRLNQ